MATTRTAPRSANPIGWLWREPLYWLLLALPTALWLKWSHADAVWLFVASGVAIIPLAGLMGRATENLAETLGAGIGGLLNATFGNAAELIIALMMLWKGPELYDTVKATLTGSIIGNILLVLGLAILLGGFYHKRQEFNRTAASMGTSMMALAAIGLLVPSLFFWLAAPSGAAPNVNQQRTIEHLSEEIAVVLAIVYVLSLVFSLVTHRHLFAGPEEQMLTTGEHRRPEWGRTFSLLVLLVSTGGVALMSETLVGSVEQAAESLGMNNVFIGVIVVAIVGNAAEHSTAVLVAMKNKMDLAVTIAIGSSLQVALFVAPVLVFASMAMGHPQPLDLHFTPLEVAAVVLSILVLSLICVDGESHWMEGVMLLAVYIIFGLAFYNLPVPIKGEVP